MSSIRQIIIGNKTLIEYGTDAKTPYGTSVSSIKTIYDGKKSHVIYGTTIKIIDTSTKGELY